MNEKTLYAKLEALRALPRDEKTLDRVLSELEFSAYMSAARGGEFDSIVEACADALISAKEAPGVLTPEDAGRCEALLFPLEKAAKSYRMHMVAHAHIDMNWQWGYDETAATTIDTFRTMLDLLGRYPSFTFSQSQASTYRIVEEFCPEMLAEIGRYIDEGRWEVLASTWVENDENMPCGESYARQMLTTRRYLTSLFGEKAICPIDFQPDTFGHNAALPQIMAGGGVKYFYHCRGNDASEAAYRWRGGENAELLCWCDPVWYSGEIEPSVAYRMPSVCARYGINSYLSVYGVGDHGGGPSARDIERLLEISEWRVMPTFLFSTFGAFFAELEKEKEKLPVKRGEQNFVFTGCYSSHSETKRSHRLSEIRLTQSEELCAEAVSAAGSKPAPEVFTEAWRQVLYNEFHDILPGSGVLKTTEYASACFQRAAAAARTRAGEAMRGIAENIDLSGVLEVGTSDCSAGAGEGAGIGENALLSVPGQYGGKKRAFCLFNPSDSDFEGAALLSVWNWQGNAARASFTDVSGTPLSFAQFGREEGNWTGSKIDFHVDVKIPAHGYTTVVLDETPVKGLPPFGEIGTRQTPAAPETVTLENESLRAVFDRRTMTLRSFTDLETSTGLVRPGAGYFEEAVEVAAGMTSWQERPFLSVSNLNENGSVRVGAVSKNPLCSSIDYVLSYGAGSTLSVRVKLEKGARALGYEVTCDSRDRGDRRTTPRLHIVFPTAYTSRTYRFDLPYGYIDRPVCGHDLPALSLAAALRDGGETTSGEGPCAVLLSEGKYAFRGRGDALALTLLRATSDPDPLPEYGVHRFRFALGSANTPDAASLDALCDRFLLSPVCCPARRGRGTPTLPPRGSFFSLDGGRVCAVKPSEDGTGTVLRLYAEKGGRCSLRTMKEIAYAALCDVYEQPLDVLAADGRSVSFLLPADTPGTLLVRFK